MSTVPSSAGKIERWQPPSGMVWHTPDTKCNPTREYGLFIQGCYFGSPKTPSEHAGLAFFQKCWPYQQKRPFIVADFATNTFDFYSDPSKEEARVFHGDLGSDGDIDPEPFLVQLPAINGPCWPERGAPT